MKFLIRDDDPCTMTRPEELERCWAHVWDEVPIGFSVTPFRVPGSEKGVPEEFFGGEEPLPLEENRVLVEYLRELIAEKKAHVAMHGYNHTKPGGKPEYVAAKNLREKTLQGRIYLEKLLGCEINTFVPPNNEMSLEGFRAVSAAKMNIVNNQPYGRLIGVPRSPQALADFLIALQLSWLRRAGMRSPYGVQPYPRFKQLSYQTVGPSTDLKELTRSFEECEDQDGIFVLATHYHAFERRLGGGEQVGEVVSQVIDAARRSAGVEFPTYDQIWASASR